MTKLEIKNIQRLMPIPIYLGLIVTMFINGLNLLNAETTTFFKYLNIYNSIPIKEYPHFFEIIFIIIAITQLIAAFTLTISLAKRDFLKSEPSILKLGVLFSIFSLVLYGFMVRIISNHSGAANLYFYLTTLYFLLAYIERSSLKSEAKLFDQIKIIPIYISIFYTMGFPGFEKIINTSKVMGKYIKMFEKSIIAQFPGGVEPVIYLLGALELIVPTLLLISLINKELSSRKAPIFLNIALLTTIITFVVLSFGLGVLLNYQGSTNLILYAIMTLGLYSYVNKLKKTT